MASLIAAAVALTGCAAPGGADSAAPSETSQVDNSPEPTQQFDNTEGLAITLTVDGVKVPATMVNNATAQEFASILPINVTMRDMIGRKAYGGGLPVDLTDDAPRRTDYEVGEFVYCPPSNGLAVYYAVAGNPVPEPRLIPLGVITDNVEAFDLSGIDSAEVTIALAE